MFGKQTNTNEEVIDLSFLDEMNDADRKKWIVSEFYNCKDDFFYFVDKYVRVKHPNKNVIKMKIFDYQYDVAYPIVTALKHGRNETTHELLRKFEYKFDYNKWMRDYIDKKYGELKEKIPIELDEYYSIIIDNPLNKESIDTIILKSRQTGLSTIFQTISVWHCNFYTNKYHIVVSFRDKDAMKYGKDIKTIYGLIPNVLRCKYVKNNDHELELVVPDIQKDENDRFIVNFSNVYRSRIFTQTATELRGDPPNLLVLDEFAAYTKAEQLWESAAFAISGGGIIVIISTPKGIGNLYYQLWTLTKKTLLAFADNPLENKQSMDLNLTAPFRMSVVHWTQLPEEEFTRRGFNKPIDWYNWMASRFRMEGGEQKIAQELDLKFISSGNTYIPGIVIERYEKEKNILDIIKTPKKHDNLYIYEEPLVGVEYILSADVSKGVGKDFSVCHILREDQKDGTPVICAEFKSNTTNTDDFGAIIYNLYQYYLNEDKNRVFLAIEQNNHGLAVISYLINSCNIEKSVIMNSYDFKKREFKKKDKGFTTSGTSRDIIITHFRNTIIDRFIPVTASIFDEMKVFVDNGKKIEALSGHHDDHIMCLSIGLYSLVKLLPLYKQYLEESGEITVLPDLYSSSLPDNDGLKLPEGVKKKKKEPFSNVKEKPEELILNTKTSEIDERLKIKFLSKVYTEETMTIEDFTY